MGLAKPTPEMPAELHATPCGGHAGSGPEGGNDRQQHRNLRMMVVRAVPPRGAWLPNVGCGQYRTEQGGVDVVAHR